MERMELILQAYDQTQLSGPAEVRCQTKFRSHVFLVQAGTSSNHVQVVPPGQGGMLTVT
jgi:hypothetical protein